MDGLRYGFTKKRSKDGFLRNQYFKNQLLINDPVSVKSGLMYFRVFDTILSY